MNIVLWHVSVGPNWMSNKQGLHVEINVDYIVIVAQNIYTNILYFDIGPNGISNKWGSRVNINIDWHTSVC
jgi:hypothetical protein